MFNSSHSSVARTTYRDVTLSNILKLDFSWLKNFLWNVIHFHVIPFLDFSYFQMDGMDANIAMGVLNDSYSFYK